MPPRRRRWPVLLVLAVAFAFGCGDDDGDGGDDGGDDGAVVDAASGADSGDGDQDASLGETTACPPTPDLECNAATEICVVETPVGPGMTSSCQPLPEGCQAERTCECAGDDLCKGAFDTCSEGETENTIVCECLECQ